MDENVKSYRNPDVISAAVHEDHAAEDVAEDITEDITEDSLPMEDNKRQINIPELRKVPTCYAVPKRDGSVWPEDICPAYTEREDAIPSLRGCWYCKYADFHLKEETALEVGICRWPKKVME